VPNTPNVSVGPSTIAGWSSTITGLVLAIIALTTGDHTQQTIGAVVGGTLAVVSFTVTQVGRYAQAHALAKRAPAAPQVTSDAPIRQAARIAAAEAVARAQEAGLSLTSGARTPTPSDHVDGAWTGPEAPTSVDDDDLGFVPPEDGELDLEDPYIDEPGYGEAESTTQHAHVRLYDEADGERIAAAQGASA
jgi:hypothetical protein